MQAKSAVTVEGQRELVLIGWDSWVFLSTRYYSTTVAPQNRHDAPNRTDAFGVALNRRCVSS
jgi:hypothetical protein